MTVIWGTQTDRAIQFGREMSVRLINIIHNGTYNNNINI